MIASRSVYMARHPRGSYILYPFLSLEVVTAENKSIQWTLSCICRKIECSSPFMRLAQHLTALRAWCNVFLVGENRRAPSRHCRDARVYGRKTTAVHDTSTSLPHAFCFVSRSQRNGRQNWMFPSWKETACSENASCCTALPRPSSRWTVL